MKSFATSRVKYSRMKVVTLQLHLKYEWRMTNGNSFVTNDKSCLCNMLGTGWYQQKWQLSNAFKLLCCTSQWILWERGEQNWHCSQCSINLILMKSESFLYLYFYLNPTYLPTMQNKITRFLNCITKQKQFNSWKNKKRPPPPPS